MCSILDAHIHCRVGSIHILLNAMDLAEVDRAIILAWPGESEQLLEEVHTKGHHRLRVAIAPDFREIGTVEWDRQLDLVQRLLPYAVAVKLYKEIGLGENNRHGCEMSFLSPSLEPLWDIVENYGKPVIIHCADPADFWGRGQLRARQLIDHPEWQYSTKPQIKSREWVLSCRAELVRRRSAVQFVGAHLGGFPVHAEQLEEFLLLGPIDTSAAIEEVLTYDRSTVLNVFHKHNQDIMWGSDLIVGPPKSQRDVILTRIYAKFLCDSVNMLLGSGTMHTPNSDCPWTVQGLDLKGDIAEHIMWGNAMRLLWTE